MVTKLNTSWMEQKIDNLMITSFHGFRKYSPTILVCVGELKIGSIVDLDVLLLQ